MDKCLCAALADELINTVVHKFQIPNSGVQLEVQAEAIKELARKIQSDCDVEFPDDFEIWVERVKNQMPAVYGMVPRDHDTLRRIVDDALSKDKCLNNVVKISMLRGSREEWGQLSQLKSVLEESEEPDIRAMPDELKDKLIEEFLTTDGLMFLPGEDDVRAVVDLAKCLELETSDISQFARHAATIHEESDKVRRIFRGEQPELPTMADQIESMGRIDIALDNIYRKAISDIYDKGK